MLPLGVKSCFSHAHKWSQRFWYLYRLWAWNGVQIYWQLFPSFLKGTSATAQSRFSGVWFAQPRAGWGWEVWRQIGDIIDSHISWPWKQFFAWKIVLRVILLSSIIFVASVSLVFESSCPSFVSSYCLLRGTASLSSCRQSLSIVVTSLRRFVRFSFRRLRYMSSLELCISFDCCNRTIFLWIK